jgi:hypothetical protein
MPPKSFLKQPHLAGTSVGDALLPFTQTQNVTRQGFDLITLPACLQLLISTNLETLFITPWFPIHRVGTDGQKNIDWIITEDQWIVKNVD